MVKPKASVIVCSKDRAPLLRKCLDSILAAKWSFEEPVEVLVIDNASTDETPEVVGELVERDPRLRCVREDRAGKSFALNRAIEESRSDLLIFTDDDTTVDPDWLDVLVRAGEEIPADAYGGRVVPEWSVPVPGWVPRLPSGKPYGGAIVEHDRGDQPCTYDLETPGYPLGANVAIRRHVFEKIGGYHPDLGLVGKARIGGQDTDLARRMLTAGMKIVYVPDAVVYHPVLVDRLTKEFFRQWFYSHARGDILASDGWKKHPAILGFPRRDLSGLVTSSLRMCVRRLVGEPHEAFAEQCCLLVHWGHLVEILRQRRWRSAAPLDKGGRGDLDGGGESDRERR